ncbi:MAG: CRISPR-associated endonuclease Cas2 [Deltaproteobacteria bacterium]|nr:CRISPR-associated endonuclease Cas2 [Deltaproteobacteria bacterium]
MITLITYDITDPKRLRKLHSFLKDFGINTQKSVFECELEDDAMKKIRGYCREKLDLDEDSVRIYRICASCIRKVEISGQGIRVTNIDYMVI